MDTVDFALACYRTPLAHQDRLSLAAPLPGDLEQLLRLANGSPDILDRAARQTGALPRELQDAARFCIQQWCLVRGADPYRVLGVAPGAPPEQIKTHYRLLMRLFHPDRAAGRETWTEHYASRINAAWTALSGMPDRALAGKRSSPPQVPAVAPVRLPTGRSGARSRLLAARPAPASRRRTRRRWLPGLVWAGVVLAALAVLGECYLDRFSASRQGFAPARGAAHSLPAAGAPAPAPAGPGQ